MTGSFKTFWKISGAIIVIALILPFYIFAAAPSDNEKTPLKDSSAIREMKDEKAAADEERLLLEAETRRLAGQKGDTVFTEIHVSPDGAYAIDSAGNEWEYDFTQDKFITEEFDKTGTKTVFGKKRPAPPVPPALDEKQLEEIAKKMEKAKSMKGLKFGSVLIDTDEKVRGPIIAMGAVTVRGKVIGDVFSYQKITVTSTGQITGNARAPEIVKMRGGIILGDRLEQDFFQMPPDIEDIFKGKSFSENSYVALIANTIIYFVLLILCLLAIAIFSRPVDRVKVCLQKSFFKSFFAGLLIWVAYTPVMGLLVLTIIGIPVALIAMPILVTLAAILGVIGFSQLVGEKMSKYIGGISKSQVWQVLLGITLLEVFWILMSLFYIKPGGVGEGFAILFMVLSIIIWSIAVTAGVGAVFLTRYGRRECKASIDIEIRIDGVKPPPPTPPPLSPDK
ncbi:MAG: hypothetical protein CVT49_04545 [candidate division Zixibacteria bacterium HGW-Zixibacteria-1]|nr:MAG: hypothetical protein CVT49_04545 [candidate division Zixibacteria bacterium HGW-Zixibacteria-1]